MQEPEDLEAPSSPSLGFLPLDPADIDAEADHKAYASLFADRTLKDFEGEPEDAADAQPEEVLPSL